MNLHLSERTWCDHIVHPLHSEASAQLDCLHMTFSCSSKSGEEEAHAEGIVDITEGINEGWIPAKQRSTSNIYEVLFWQKHLTFEIKKNQDNLHIKSCKKNYWQTPKDSVLLLPYNFNLIHIVAEKKKEEINYALLCSVWRITTPPFFDDVIQFIGRLVLSQSFHCRPLCFSISLLKLTHKYLQNKNKCWK